MKGLDGEGWNDKHNTIIPQTNKIQLNVQWLREGPAAVCELQY